MNFFSLFNKEKQKNNNKEKEQKDIKEQGEKIEQEGESNKEKSGQGQVEEVKQEVENNKQESNQKHGENLEQERESNKEKNIQEQVEKVKQKVENDKQKSNQKHEEKIEQEGENNQNKNTREQVEEIKQEVEDNKQESTQEQSEKKEQNKNEARESFKELLRNNIENQNISIGSEIELNNIDDYENKEIPDSIINVIIEKFLNRTFMLKENELNSRRESLTPTVGDIKWNIPNLVRHRNTKQYNQMLHDKYGYTKENGRDEKIPLAFYFDLSGSMQVHSRNLSLIALKLLKKNIKVLVGENERLEYQINDIPVHCTIEELAEAFENGEFTANKFKNGIEQIDDMEIDEYLIKKKTKKVAIFSDFDPKDKIENLSQNCEVYWFCTEERNYYKNSSLDNFKGHFYSMHSMKDLLNHLRNINNRYYENMQKRNWEGER